MMILLFNQKRSRIKLFNLINILLLLFKLIICNDDPDDHTENSCQITSEIKYKEYSTWQKDCFNCTCVQSVQYCQQIQCKYEPCQNGQLLVLSDNDCCPICQEAKKSCNYEGYLIHHNTEFSPKLCSTCKCKDGIMECYDNCADQLEDLKDQQQNLDDLKREKLSASFEELGEHVNSENLYRHIQATNLNQRKNRMRQHYRQHKTRNNRNRESKSDRDLASKEHDLSESSFEIKSSCFHNNKFYKFNTTWSPLRCTQCKCNPNSIVDCFVFDCPKLNCSISEYELKDNECCPSCKDDNHKCFDNILTNGRSHKIGDYWTLENDPCTHCSCNGNNRINCFVENCTTTSCGKNEILVKKSNKCCAQCEPEINENCEYYGKIHYNGEMWYTSGCQHCACDYGRVICMNVQCESQFCLKDEIMVKKKDQCCVYCRKPMYCHVNDTNGNELSIKENDFYTPPQLFQKQTRTPCKLCQCIEGKLVCYYKSCQTAKYPSYAHVNVHFNEKKQINARTIPFMADIIKTLKKDTSIFVLSGPKYSQLFKDGKPTTQFNLGDIASSKIYYKSSSTDLMSEDDDADLLSGINHNDYVTLSFVSKENGNIYNVLIQFEFKDSNESADPSADLLLRSIKNVNSTIGRLTEVERNIRGYDNKLLLVNNNNNKDLNKIPPRKTIFIHPGEAIKLTSNELKPKNLMDLPDGSSSNKLIYFLVSGNPKYGELKLKKAYSSDELNQTPLGWNKVNDIYLEKTVKEFTQADLDNGNVWYEPYNDIPLSAANDFVNSIGCANKTSKKDSKKKPCLPGEMCIQDIDTDCEQFNSGSSFSSSSSNSNNAKYDHCMFEVYDQDKLDELISKEIIHFSIQNEIINETVLGLEVIENQITPLTFSNFDIAGIDSNRDYLIYRIIKGLEKNQGQLEHVNRPGVPIETFTQHDLNKGLIIYYSPKEIGVNPREFLFTFVVTNDNRSDTFPETPFHIKVLPSNDQAPKFKEVVTSVNILQSGSLILSRDLFDVDDPDTSIDNLIFTIEKQPDNCVLELRSRGQRYIISKDDSFTIQEIRDGTFRLIQNGANHEMDTLKLSVSDSKHISIKTVNINIKLVDKIAPYISNRTTMLLNVKEGNVKVIRRENLAFVDDRSTPDDIIYKLVMPKSSTNNNNNKLVGKLYFRDKILINSMMFTQADIDLQNIRYEAPQEIGQNVLTELIYFDVNDKEGNTIRDQIFTIKVEPIDNQSPIVEVLQQPVTVIEGGYLLLNESFIQVRDDDSAKEQLNIIIDSQPSFGYIENIQKGTKISSFSVIDLINGLNIRYVQNDHENKEPNSDTFMFHVSDGINESQTYKFSINIELINDEQPVAIFEPLYVEHNKRVTLTNSTFFIVDFDSKPEDILIYIEEFPKYGKIFYSNTQINHQTNKFTYADILKKLISYKLEDRNAIKDEFKLRITDGNFTTMSKFQLKKLTNDKNAKPIVEKNEGLQAIAGHIFPITKEMLRSISASVVSPKNNNNNNDIDTSFYFNLNLNDNNDDIIYKIIMPPLFGKLQYRYDTFYEDLAGPNSFMSSFTQRDVNEGRVFYNHAVDEPTGVTSVTFNVTDNAENTLADQRFIITVRGDKLPPVITVNKGLKVSQGQSNFLTRYELDVKDDDTLVQNLKFYILTQPKLGRIENIKEPGKRIDSFTYDDIFYNRIKYVHDEKATLETPLQNAIKSIMSPSSSNNIKDDWLDLKVSDGKNDVTTNINIKILRNDNHLPVLKSTYSMKCKELERKQITQNEIKVFDKDTPNDKIKIIITHPPQYGTIEKLFYITSQSSSEDSSVLDDYDITDEEAKLSKKISKKIEDKLVSINPSLNKKFNFILKFNRNNRTKSQPKEKKTTEYKPVNEFTMSDLIGGLIFYNHRSPGVRTDRFGFIVYDGSNNVFIIDGGIQVSSFQVFNIHIDLDKNQPPKIEKNIGIDYLYQIDGYPGRLIMKNELSIVDKDDSDQDIRLEITRKPVFGTIEHKDRPGIHISKLSQNDINQNKIYYLLSKDKIDKNNDDSSVISEDFFEFDVFDSANNVLKQNRFNIKWSIVNFEEKEISIMESDGKARVHIKKTGNLKQFSMVTCKTVSDTAKSNRDSKMFDFVHTHVRIELNEDESYKACDIIIQKDNQIEPIESFYVVLEDAKYSIIGAKWRVKINLLDKRKESVIEFEKVKFDVFESDKFVSLPIMRTGDLNHEITIECLTQDETAVNGQDYVSRNIIKQNSIVKIPAGEVYGFCDIEIIDDDVHEVFTESFRTILSNPSTSDTKIGSKSEARIFIIGPNDVEVNECKTVYETVSENIGKFTIELNRQNIALSAGNQNHNPFNHPMLNETLDLFVSTVQSTDEMLKNYIKYIENKIANNENSNDNSNTNKAEMSKMSNIKDLNSNLNQNNNNDLSLSMKTYQMYKNITAAIENIDYEPIKNQLVRFLPGETTKKIQVNILDDSQYPIMEGLKMFTVQVKPKIINAQNNKTQCNYVNPDIVHVVIEDMADDLIIVGFNQTNIVINETCKFVKIPIIRYGDISQPVSVICYTRQLTAIEDKDYIGRSSLEQSRIYFEPGEKAKYCNIDIINDSIFEADETFQVKLNDLRSASNSKLNQFTSITVTILNDEDTSVISLSDEVYYTEEPSSSDASVFKPITIIRTGDLSRVTQVRISTSDDTATAGTDYKPKTETIRFNPGVSALDFEVEILYDTLKESSHESFKVTLGPQDPISGVFGKIKTASVVIRDNNNNNSSLSSINLPVESDSENSQLPDKLVLTSLYNFVSYIPSKNTTKVPHGEPLICIEPCDTKNPYYDPNHPACSRENLSHNKFVYSWEISTPNEFGMYSSYIKLIDNSIYFFVNESVLEPLYLQPKFRVRCTVKKRFILSESDNQAYNTDSENSPLIRSNYIEISDENEYDIYDRKSYKYCHEMYNEISQSRPNYTSEDQKDEKQELILEPAWTSLNSKVYYDKQLQDQSLFQARADYISAEFITNNPLLVDVEYLNYIRLVVEVPFIDNSIVPLVSTVPLHNYRYLLNDPTYSLNHICSNFIQSHLSRNYVRYGFTKTDEEFNFVKTGFESFDLFRNNKTLSFYKSLNRDKCKWVFTAYYDISELTTHCQAQIITDGSSMRSLQQQQQQLLKEQQKEDDNSYLTIKIPLYVSYIYASNQASWSSIEFKSQVEASIIYKTVSVNKKEDYFISDAALESAGAKNTFMQSKNNKNIHLNKANDNDKNLLSLNVNKITMTPDGRLVLEFVTVANFYGKFIKHHKSLPGYRSLISGPYIDYDYDEDDDSYMKTDFNLELIWSQYTYENPEQTWKATSTTILNNYSGNYTLKLIPCYAKPEQAFKHPFDCQPMPPINYTIPILIEQSIKPVPLKYTLGTKFTVSNVLGDILNNELISEVDTTLNNQTFDGYFRRDDTVYAKVLWLDSESTDFKHKKSTLYKLYLDKVYLCSSLNSDFIPTYDPDGKVYSNGPQYGCTKPHKLLKHRILLLDRNNVEQQQQSQKSKFEAKFLSELLINYTKSSADGFKFNINALINIDANTTNPNEDILWYVQVLYFIRPSVASNNMPNSFKKRDNYPVNSEVYSLNGIYNNGTNMQMIRVTNRKINNSKMIINSLLSSNYLKNKQQLIQGNSQKQQHKLNKILNEDIYFKRLNENNLLLRTYTDVSLKLVIPTSIIVLFVLLITIISFIYYYKNKKTTCSAAAAAVAAVAAGSSNSSSTNSSATSTTSSGTTSAFKKILLCNNSRSIMQKNITSDLQNNVENEHRQDRVKINPLIKFAQKFRNKANENEEQVNENHQQNDHNENAINNYDVNTGDAMVVTPLLNNNLLVTVNSNTLNRNNQNKKPQHYLQNPYKTEDSNCTLQTLISTNPNINSSSCSSNNPLFNNSSNYSLNYHNINHHRLYANAEVNLINEDEVRDYNDDELYNNVCSNDDEDEEEQEYDENVCDYDYDNTHYSNIGSGVKLRRKEDLHLSKDKKANSKIKGGFKLLLQRMSSNPAVSKQQLSPTHRANQGGFNKNHQLTKTTSDYDEITKKFIQADYEMSKHNRPFSLRSNNDSANTLNKSSMSSMNRVINVKSTRNNYLYFNYNNNKMNVNNPDLIAASGIGSELILTEQELLLNNSDANTNTNHTGAISKTVITSTPLIAETIAAIAQLQSSSTPNQITPVSSTTKCSISNKVKRLSGTEV